MKKYDIDAIRCYQAVMFNKGNETFFATRRINHQAALEIEIIEDLKVISIKSDRDHILIPLTNASAIYLMSPINGFSRSDVCLGRTHFSSLYFIFFFLFFFYRRF